MDDGSADFAAVRFAYASGRIASQAELRRFFEAQPAYPKDLPTGQIRQQRISDLIARVIYAGYIEHEPWGVTRRKGAGQKRHCSTRQTARFTAGKAGRCDQRKGRHGL